MQFTINCGSDRSLKRDKGKTLEEIVSVNHRGDALLSILFTHIGHSLTPTALDIDTEASTDLCLHC
jgi:hypothetical protein